MLRRSQVAVVFALVAAGLVGWLWSAARRPEASAPEPAAADAGPGVLHPLDAAPEGALLLATVDVRALRQTALGERLLGRGRRIGGLGLVSDVCGGDPMEGIAELAIAVPEAADEGGFAVLASGAIDADAMLRCAETVIRQRGGRPVVSPIGGFRVLRDSSLGEPGPELAVARRDVVILAQGETLRASIDAAEGRLPNARRHPAHAELRAAVGPGAVVATVVLTPELRRTLAEELSLQGLAGSPAASLLAAGLSVRLGAALSLHLVLRCDRAPPCRELARALDEGRRHWIDRLGAPQAALGDVLERAKVRVEGTQIHVELQASAERAAEVLEALAAVSEHAPSAGPADAATDDGGGGDDESPAAGAADGGAAAGGPTASPAPPGGARRPRGVRPGALDAGALFDGRH